jgi:hypothetical protein
MGASCRARKPRWCDFRLLGGDADEVHDDEGGDGEEDGGEFAHDVVEDLNDGLADGGGEDGSRVAHAEG